MPEYELTEIHEGSNILFLFFIEDATSLNDSERAKILKSLQKCARKANMNGDVGAAWKQGGKLRFMAPVEWHRHLMDKSIAELKRWSLRKVSCD